MEFRTPVQIDKPTFSIEPMDEMLFVGSCFADSIGRRFQEEKFPAVVNPFGTMYNPVSVLHTLERYDATPRIVFITLGTNHVYRLKATGEIVDNCQKRPQSLFTEEELSVDACADCLQRMVDLLRERRTDVQIVFTVSPIRYRKYGYHASQLSKATLLLAIHQLLNSQCSARPQVARKARILNSHLTYFPAYELVLDELRDYRFYASDMLHPSEQAVEYIWEKLVEHYFSARARQFLADWRPVKEALGHRPFNPDSAQYQQFLTNTRRKAVELCQKYPGLRID